MISGPTCFPIPTSRAIRRCSPTGSCSVSRDGRWLATMNNENNVVTVVRLVNGIPDLTRRVQFTSFATTAAGRDIAWDAADNLYVATSGLAMVNSINLGLTATNT